PTIRSLKKFLQNKTSLFCKIQIPILYPPFELIRLPEPLKAANPLPKDQIYPSEARFIYYAEVWKASKVLLNTSKLLLSDSKLLLSDSELRLSASKLLLRNSKLVLSASKLL